MNFIYLITMLGLSIGAWFIAVNLAYRIFKRTGLISATAGLLALITTAFTIMSVTLGPA